MKGKGTMALLLSMVFLTASFLTCQGVQADDSTLYLAVLEDARNLNPYMGTGRTDQFVIGFLYDTLLGWDQEEGLIPGLADTWEIDEAENSIMYHLNPQAVWHDGEPVTAHDVAFSFSMIMEHRFPGFMAILGDLQGVEVLDTHTVQITLGQASPGNVRLISTAPSILPAHIWADIQDPRNYANVDQPIGCGPFRLIDRREGQHVVLENTQEHYRYTYHLQRIMLKLIRDETIGIMSLRDGDMDALRWNVSPDVAWEIENNPRLYPSIQVARAPSTTVTTLTFNVREKPLNDVAVRRAIAHAIDQEIFIDRILQGYGRVQGPGLVAPGLPFYNEELPPREQDLEKARAILEEAGYAMEGEYRVDSQGNRLVLEILTMSHSTHMNIAELLVRQLGQVGIEATYRPLSPEAHRTSMTAANYQAAVSSLGFSNPDMIFFYFHTSRGLMEEGRVTGFNRGGYSDEELDAVSEDLRVEMDEEKRMAMLLRVQELMAKAYYHLPLYSADILMLYSEENLTGWTVEADEGFDHNQTYRALQPVE